MSILPCVCFISACMCLEIEGMWANKNSGPVLAASNWRQVLTAITDDSREVHNLFLLFVSRTRSASSLTQGESWTAALVVIDPDIFQFECTI